MYIFNTTYHAHNSCADKFIQWLRDTYIPKALDSCLLIEPQLSLIMATQQGDEGSSYSLQFKVSDLNVLEKWYGETGTFLIKEMQQEFSQNVAGFSTIMEIMDT